MALIYNRDNVTYFCLSTDVIGNKVTGASVKGAKIYLTDTAEWKYIKDDLTLAPYTFPISPASGSSLSLGSSESHIGTTSGIGNIVSASFAGVGSATLHAANSYIAPIAGGVVEIPNAVRINGGSAYITDISLTTNASGVTIVPRIHFFSSSTVTVAPDSGSYVDLFADESVKFGYYTMPAMYSATGSATDCSRTTTTDATFASQPRILVKAASNTTSIFYGIETTTAFTTTASEIWRIKLRMDEN